MFYSNLRSVLIATTLITGLWGCNSGQSPQSSNPTTAQKYVAVTQIVEHPALDATRKGVQDELAAAGLKVGENLKWEWESAQGNPTTAAQIANKFVGENPDVIVAISTPSAQAAVATARSIPVIFTAITDPLAAKLVSNLEKPGGLVTGVMDFAPVTEHLALITEIAPETKRVGVVYNPGETNSVSLVNILKEETQKRGLTLVEAPANRSSDVATATRSLVGKADAVYIPTDNTIVSALESAIQVGIENKLPIYAGDTDSVKRGAIASLGFNYYDVGRETGKIVLQVLNGQKPGDIPVKSIQEYELFINSKSANSMGVKIPETVTKRADQIIK